MKKHLLRSRSGEGYPMVIAVTLCLLMLFLVIAEYFRVNIIVQGVRDAMQQAVIATVNENYDDVYHSVREGYAAGWFPEDDGEWSESCLLYTSGGFQAAVILAGGKSLAPLLPHLIVYGGFQFRQCRIHIGVDVLDPHEKAAEHSMHRRVQIVDVLLHGGLQILTAEVRRGDDGERRFQLGGDVFLVMSGRQLDVPKRHHHHARRQHRHQQDVVHDDGDTCTDGTEQQRRCV